MKIIFRPILLFTLLTALTACTTKVLRPDLENQISKKPQLEDYHDGWFLGFIQKGETNPKEACVNDTPVKLKRFFSFEDFLLSLITIGVYTPTTTQVWCLPEASTKTPPQITTQKN